MTKWMRFACLAVCVLCTLFCAVGYAAISGNLTISGQVELVALPPPEKVVITNVELMPGSTATSDSFNFTNQATLLTNTITGQAGEKVIYKITAHNYSPTIKYAYMEQADATAELNENLTVAVMAADASGNMTETVFAPGTAVLPGEDIVFYAVYTVTTTVDHVDSVVNYPFGIHVDSAGAGAMQGATETFLNILNTQSEDLQNLFDCMGRDFTGNVVPDNGSNGLVSQIINWLNLVPKLGEEKNAADALFGEDLTITYTDENGEEHEQTMATIIARENVDGRPGDEMVLYLTPFNFDNAQITSSDVRVPVLAAVFTNSLYGTATEENPGTWFQLGEIYEGAAKCATWITWGGGMGNPSRLYNADCFDPTTWRAGKVTTYQEGETGGIAGTVKSTENRTYTHDNIKTAGGASFSYTIEKDTPLAEIMTTPAGDNQALLCDEVYAANGALSKVDGIYAKIEAGNVYGNVTVDSPEAKNLRSTQSSAETLRIYYNNDITPMTLPEALTAHRVVDAVAPFLNASTE